MLFGILVFIICQPTICEADKLQRIIGGDKVESNTEYPFMAALLQKGSNSKWIQYCTGTLVHPNYVITAAHCQKKATIRVILGTVDWKDPPPSAESFDVTQEDQIINPKYDAKDCSVLNDIALFKLDRAAKISGKSIRKIDYAKQTIEMKAGTKGIVLGWGYNQWSVSTGSSGGESSKLRVIKLPIRTAAECSGSSSQKGAVDFCAGYNDQTKGIGSGDSGGPWIYKDVLRGVVSNTETANKTCKGKTKQFPGYVYIAKLAEANISKWLKGYLEPK